MPVTTTTPDLIRELLIGTAHNLQQQLVGEIVTPGLGYGNLGDVLIPRELQSDPRFAKLLSQVQMGASKAIKSELLTLLTTWQAKAIKQQLPEIQTLFDRQKLGAIFNPAETHQILMQAQRQHQLFICVAPPKVSPNCPIALQSDLALDLPEELHGFFCQHYALGQHISPIQFYGDFCQRSLNDGDLYQLHAVLNTVPTIVVYSTISDRKVYLHLAFWHLQEQRIYRWDCLSWDWETTYTQLLAQGKTEVEGIRQIRQTIATLHQFLATCQIDLYYLLLDPSYTPRLRLLESLFIRAGLTKEGIAPYLDIFHEIHAPTALSVSAAEPEAESNEPTPAFTPIETIIRPQKEWKCVATLTGHRESVYSLAFNPDGTMLASGSNDQTIKLWDLHTGTPIRDLDGHLWVRSVAVSPNGTTVASAGGDRTVRIWDTRTGEEIRAIEAHEGDISSVLFVPNSHMLVTASWDYTTKLWNMRTGNKIRTLVGHRGLVNCVAVSPNGQILATGSHDNKIKLWNIESGREILTINGHKGSVNAIAFSPDGQSLASCSDDRTIRIWSIKTAQEITMFAGYFSAVNSVAFSPDGEFLASGSDDKSIQLCNLTTGQAMHLFGHEDSVYYVTFSPDGKTLASSSSDATIKLWCCE
jgi:WD40 repeat protein